jgi:hypothetical protein
MNGIPFKALFFGKIAETGNAKKDSQTYYPPPPIFIDYNNRSLDRDINLFK